MFLHFMLMSANSPPNNGDTWGVTKFQRPKYKNAQSDQFNAPDHALSVSCIMIYIYIYITCSSAGFSQLHWSGV